MSDELPPISRKKVALFWVAAATVSLSVTVLILAPWSNTGPSSSVDAEPVALTDEYSNFNPVSWVMPEMMGDWRLTDEETSGIKGYLEPESGCYVTLRVEDAGFSNTSDEDGSWRVVAKRLQSSSSGATDVKASELDSIELKVNGSKKPLEFALGQLDYKSGETSYSDVVASRYISKSDQSVVAQYVCTAEKTNVVKFRQLMATLSLSSPS